MKIRVKIVGLAGVIAKKRSPLAILCGGSELRDAGKVDD